MDQAAVTSPAGAPPAGAGGVPAWTRPGAEPVAPGVHRIPLPLPSDALRAVNVYAIDDGDGLALIDSGWALDVARAELEAALAGLGRKLDDVAVFLITHLHRDHYTQAIALRRELGSRVAIGIGERPSLELLCSGEMSRANPHQRRLRASGAGVVADRMRQGGRPGPDQPETPWELPDEWLVPGDVAVAGRVLEAIPTPGHTRGHLCYRDDGRGLLFAGDHVLPHITPSIGFEAAVAALPLHDYLQSLRLIRERPDTLLLPAHGPAGPSVHARVDELLAHHAARLDATERAIAGGAATAYEVAQRLTWTRRERALADLDLFNQMLAILETGAHLDLLVVQGRLRAEVRDGVTGYVPR